MLFCVVIYFMYRKKPNSFFQKSDISVCPHIKKGRFFVNF